MSDKQRRIAERALGSMFDKLANNLRSFGISGRLSALHAKRLPLSYEFAEIKAQLTAMGQWDKYGGLHTLAFKRANEAIDKEIRAVTPLTRAEQCAVYARLIGLPSYVTYTGFHAPMSIMRDGGRIPATVDESLIEHEGYYIDDAITSSHVMRAVGDGWCAYPVLEDAPPLWRSMVPSNVTGWGISVELEAQTVLCRREPANPRRKPLLPP